MMKRLVTVLAAWTLAASYPAAAGPSGMPPSQARPMMAEQVIVKFARGTPGYEVYVAVLADGPQAEDRLGALAARLSGDLKVPLRIERLTSGQEFVLSLDADTMASRLVEYLETRPDLRGVRVLEAGDRARQRYWYPAVAIEIRAESRLGQDLAAPSANRAEILKIFSAEVGGDIGFPVSVRSSRPVELVIDISTVAADLVEKLERRPDVEYAQLDLRMRPVR